MNKVALILKTSVALVGVVSLSVALADAPVVDANQNQTQLAVSVANAANQNGGTDNNATNVAATTAAATPSTTVNQTALSMTMDQRVARLEQQMDYLTKMNLPQQITDLQQTMQQLQGQLQVQEHDLKLLNDQQRSFYQDLDQRMTQLKNLVPSSDSNSNSSSDTKTKQDKTTNLQMQDSDVYRAAFDLLTKKQYDKAKDAFTNYLTQYPNGDFLVNAHYWLGEIYLMQSDFKSAETEFSTVVNKFPKSNKIPDAKLKLAIVHIKLGKKDQARQELTAIKKAYPGTTAAQLADIRLQQMDTSGANATAPAVSAAASSASAPAPKAQ